MLAFLARAGRGFTLVCVLVCVVLVLYLIFKSVPFYII